MYSSLPPDIRDAHPFFMYEEMQDQPAVLEEALRRWEDQAQSLLPVFASARRVIYTGCGTSYFAACQGAHFLAGWSGGEFDARAVQAFELVNYGPKVRPDDVVVAVTHSGTSLMTVEAIAAARGQGAEAVVVTGYPERFEAQPGLHLQATGYHAEKSWAHTVSYTAAMISMAALARDISGTAVDLDVVPELLREALALEDLAHRLASTALVGERTRGYLRIVVVGAGPESITGEEVSLKLLETSYVSATAFELEQMLHGPIASLTSDDLCIIIAPSGTARERSTELVASLREVGITPVVLTDALAAEQFAGAHRVLLPDAPAPLMPFLTVIPLQLFAYYLAVGKGLNPDLIHRDDERYRQAAARYR